MGGRKRKAGKKKIKNEEPQYQRSNSSSTHSNGSAEDLKSLDERRSDKGEIEEEIVDQREVDAAKAEGLEDEVVQVAVEEETLENGSGSADFSSVSAAKEDPIVISSSEEDKEVAVEEEVGKSVIEELKADVDPVQQEAVVEFNESVGAPIADDQEDLVKEVVNLPPQEVDLEESTTKNVDSIFSQVSGGKDEVSSAVEAVESEQIEDPVKVVPRDDEGINTTSREVVGDVKHLETDDVGAAAAINGKELEILKPSEDQPLIGSNPLPVRRTSWTGCCGLFEMFSGGNR